MQSQTECSIGELLLGDAGVRPVDAIGMAERHAADMASALRLGRRGSWRFCRGFLLLICFLGIGFSRTTSRRRLVLAHTLERRVAHVALRRVQPRKSTSATSFGSTQLPLRPRSSSGILPNAGVSRAQRLELLPEVARGLASNSRCRSGRRIAASAVLVIAEHQRADRALQVRGVLVADDDEFLVLPRTWS